MSIKPIMMSPGTLEMDARSEEAAAMLKALAHPARLMIVCLLCEGERSVGEIERALDIQQPRLSRELAKLRDRGFLKTRREAKQIFYSIADPRAEALIEALCKIMKPA